MTDFCPVLSADPAVLYVSDGHKTFMNLATRTYELAIQHSAQLAGFTALPTTFTVNFDYNAAQIPFQRPLAPRVGADEFELRGPAEPARPPTFVPETPELAELPEEALPAPTLAYGPKPNPLNLAVPLPPRRPSPLVVPEAPGYALPVLPSFEALHLPNVPEIRLPHFDSPRPVFVEPPFNEDWTFSPQAYVSALLDKLRGKVGAWLDGESALPLAIERALFERGRGRIELEIAASVEQLYEDFAARGFSQPPGMLAARVDAARQAGQSRIAEYSREVAIKQFDESLANMRLAVQQGIALEGVAINLHTEEQRLALQAAQFLRDSAVSVLNARISAFNARLQAYQTEAQVFAERIRAELAKVEVYRAQIEGERARGEINEQRVRLYAEQIRALNSLADFYRARIEGVKAQADVERSIIESYKAEVDAYGARWDAYGKEWDGYRSSVEAENSKVTVHRNLVEAFSTKVQAITAGNGARLDRERLRIAQHGQQIAVFQSDLERVRALLAAEQARLGAVGQRVEAQARIYTAQGSVEQSASAAADRTFQLGLERENARVNTQLKAAEIRVQENIQLTSLLLEVRKMLAQVMSQLAASSAAAVNYSAAVSSTRSESKSCSTDFNFQGEIADSSI